MLKKKIWTLRNPFYTLNLLHTCCTLFLLSELWISLNIGFQKMPRFWKSHARPKATIENINCNGTIPWYLIRQNKYFLVNRLTISESESYMNCSKKYSGRMNFSWYKVGTIPTLEHVVLSSNNAHLILYYIWRFKNLLDLKEGFIMNEKKDVLLFFR